MAQCILLIGTARWAPALRRHWEVVHASSGKEARVCADQAFPLIIVDAASIYTTGARICRAMRLDFPQAVLIHIGGASPMPLADVSLRAQLSARVLVGVVSRVLNEDPRDAIVCGPFYLNRTTRTLRAHGRQTQLSPKVARLVDFFLRNPNTTLSRAAIMREVWNTDYLGDTRTLNVHVRHARRLLEENAHAPRYLITVRGTGYRLEISEATQKGRQSLSDSDAADSA